MGRGLYDNHGVPCRVVSRSGVVGDMKKSDRYEAGWMDGFEEGTTKTLKWHNRFGPEVWRERFIGALIVGSAVVLGYGSALLFKAAMGLICVC